MIQIAKNIYKFRIALLHTADISLCRASIDSAGIRQVSTSSALGVKDSCLKTVGLTWWLGLESNSAYAGGRWSRPEADFVVNRCHMPRNFLRFPSTNVLSSSNWSLLTQITMHIATLESVSGILTVQGFSYLSFFWAIFCGFVCFVQFWPYFSFMMSPEE